jgi:predicted TIM-barrel fold metal-dependent hydrolase
VLTTVYIETSGSVYRDGGPLQLQPVGETEFVVQQTVPPGVMSGIIGFADLMRGAAAEEIIDAHLEAAGDRFRGVRYRAMALGQPAPPPGWLANPVFHTGADVLRRKGLVLEIFVFKPEELTDLPELARAHPDLSIVLDHLGTPSLPQPGEGTRDEMLDRWRKAMESIAACDNVTLKLGGIGMSFIVDKSLFSSPPSSVEVAEYWRPEIRFAIDLFGPDRCMFESNFPIDDEFCDYVTLWNVFKRVSDDMSATERAALFHDTATRVFGLNP